MFARNAVGARARSQYIFDRRVRSVAVVAACVFFGLGHTQNRIAGPTLCTYFWGRSGTCVCDVCVFN